MKKPIVQFGEFQKLDIRVGEIVETKPLEGSKNLLALKVDFGEDYGVVEILSGIARFYKPEKLINNKYIFIANLEPRKIMGKLSNGMILATGEDKPVIFKVPKKIKNGFSIR